MSRRRIHSKRARFGSDRERKIDEVDQLRRLFIQFFIQSSSLNKKGASQSQNKVMIMQETISTNLLNYTFEAMSYDYPKDHELLL